MNNETATSCPGCGNSDLRCIGPLPDSSWFAGRPTATRLPGGSLYRCRTCALKFRHPVLDSETYRSLYDNDPTPGWLTEAPRRDWDLVANHLRSQLPEGARVLDFGCNDGSLLARLGPAFTRHGVEVNRTAASRATDRTGVEVWSSLDDIPSDIRFDAIVMADVVEHIVDPASLLERLAQRLAEGGLMLITTGDADCPAWKACGANWWYCAYPEHIAFLSRRWLRHFDAGSALSLRLCENFCYTALPFHRYLVGLTSIVAFAIAPRACLAARDRIRALLGREGGNSVPGVGVTADHLFVVLAKETPPR